MTRAVDDLLAILDLEQLEHNLYRGRSPQVGWQRVFGGQVIGQALVAACRTVEDRQPHSLHAYFLLPGDPKVPIIYEVDRIRDGRTFTTRRVVAIQHGQAIFSMSASFHVDEPGFEHQCRCPTSRARRNCPSEAEMKDRHHAADAGAGAGLLRARAADRAAPGRIRSATLAARSIEPDFNVWIRATGRLPDDPAIHQCVLAYASDMTLLDTSLIAHGRTVFDALDPGREPRPCALVPPPLPGRRMAALRPGQPDASGARGFSRGLIFDRDGTLVASVAQEGLIRERDDARPQSPAR